MPAVAVSKSDPQNVRPHFGHLTRGQLRCILRYITISNIFKIVMTKRSKPLTDLEGLVLGMVARTGPISSYKVARHFADSPSDFWSGSAGAIYPLMQRLEQRRWTKGVASATGKRNVTIYSITRAGMAPFKSWLLDAERAGDMGFDPLRSRLLFMGLLSAEERKILIEGVARKTAELKRREVADEMRESHTWWVENRLRWIGRLRRLL